MTNVTGLTNVTNSIILSFGNMRRLFHAVVPPSVDSMEELCLEGYQDALRFLKISGLLRCADCKTVTRVDCATCRQVEEEAEKSHLPESVRQVFEEARETEAAADGLFSWFIRPIEMSFEWFLPPIECSEDPFMCLLT